MMKTTTLLLAALAVGSQAAPQPQGVNRLISAGSPPQGCLVSSPKTHGFAIASASGKTLSRRQVTQIADGQIQAPAEVPATYLNSAAAPYGGVAQIADGQIQAPNSYAAAPVVESCAETVNPVTTSTSYRFSSYVKPAVDFFYGARAAEGCAAPAEVNYPAGGVTQIADGQIQAPNQLNSYAVTDYDLNLAGGATQIADGQIQAPNEPNTYAAAPACGAENLNLAAVPEYGVTQIADGQIQAPANYNLAAYENNFNQIADGQIQAPADYNNYNLAAADYDLNLAGGVTQIADGQIQAPNQLNSYAAAPACGAENLNLAAVPEYGVTQIADGQIQAPASYNRAAYENNVNQIADGQIQAPADYNNYNLAAADYDLNLAGGVTQIADGQIQAPNQLNSYAAAPACGAENLNLAAVPEYGVTQIADGQIQAPASYNRAAYENNVNQIADGQIQTPASYNRAAYESNVNQIADGQIQAPALNKRQNGPPLSITLKGGVLTDSLGRTGYIADNRQLQFDRPPQSGAVFTGGFSACDDGKLALGNQKTFFACGSSDCKLLHSTHLSPFLFSPHT
jgi:hypothetical protein